MDAEPMCACGHTKSSHPNVNGPIDYGGRDPCTVRWCDCSFFRERGKDTPGAPPTYPKAP